MVLAGHFQPLDRSKESIISMEISLHLSPSSSLWSALMPRGIKDATEDFLNTHSTI